VSRAEPFQAGARRGAAARRRQISAGWGGRRARARHATRPLKVRATARRYPSGRAGAAVGRRHARVGSASAARVNADLAWPAGGGGAARNAARLSAPTCASAGRDPGLAPGASLPSRTRLTCRAATGAGRAGSALAGLGARRAARSGRRRLIRRSAARHHREKQQPHRDSRGSRQCHRTMKLQRPDQAQTAETRLTTRTNHGAGVRAETERASDRDFVASPRSDKIAL